MGISGSGPLPPKLSAPRLAWSWELARSRRPGRGRREAQQSFAAQLPAAGGSTPGDPPSGSPGEEGGRRRRSRMIVNGESPLTRLVAKVLSLLSFHFARHQFTLFYSTFVPNGKPTRLSGQNAGFLKSLSFLARQSASEPRALRLVLDELYYRSFILQGHARRLQQLHTASPVPRRPAVLQGSTAWAEFKPSAAANSMPSQAC